MNLENVKICKANQFDFFTEYAVLLNESFNCTNFTKEYLIEKHVLNVEGPSIIAYKIVEEDLVSARAFLRHDLIVNSIKLFCYQPCDTVTHIKYRRRGLFKLMTTKCIDLALTEGCKLLYNFPNSQSLGPYLKLGWVEFMKIKYGIFIPFLPFKIGNKIEKVEFVSNLDKSKLINYKFMSYKGAKIYYKIVAVSFIRFVYIPNEAWARKITGTYCTHDLFVNFKPVKFEMMKSPCFITPTITLKVAPSFKTIQLILTKTCFIHHRWQIIHYQRNINIF